MIAGNGNSFIFSIKNDNEFIKLECINKDKEIWNSKNNMPSFGSMDIRLVNYCDKLDRSLAIVGHSYELPSGIE
jgi:hypothetical protein